MYTYQIDVLSRWSRLLISIARGDLDALSYQRLVQTRFDLHDDRSVNTENTDTRFKWIPTLLKG